MPLPKAILGNIKSKYPEATDIRYLPRGVLMDAMDEAGYPDELYLSDVPFYSIFNIDKIQMLIEYDLTKMDGWKCIAYQERESLDELKVVYQNLHPDNKAAKMCVLASIQTYNEFIPAE